MNFTSFLSGIGIDLAAVLILTLGIYYPRHRRMELVGSLVVLNLGVYSAVTMLAAAPAAMALGMGLFGILSIIRLRSTQVNQSEVAYYFIALTTGLINSLGTDNLAVMATLNVLLLAAIFCFDRKGSMPAAESRVIKLDVAHADERTLRADLERRLGQTVHGAVIKEVDYVASTTVCQVSLPPLVAEASGLIIRHVTLERVYDGLDTLRFELERRLGEEVVDISVTEVDYIRDMTVCDVKCIPLRPGASALTREGIVQ